jgi:hypothetical protein
VVEPEDPEEPEEGCVTEPEEEGEVLEELEAGVVCVFLAVVGVVTGGRVPVVPPAGTVRPVAGLVPV